MSIELDPKAKIKISTICTRQNTNKIKTDIVNHKGKNVKKMKNTQRCKNGEKKDQFKK